jgi:hypothetical protein
MFRLDDLVLLGPGSEWFWTFAQALALAITFIAIYRQLRAARSAAEFEQVREIEAEFYSVRLTRARLSLYEHLRGRSPDQGLPAGAIDVLCWYDNLGYLVGAGHLSADWFHASWGASIQNEWWLLQPYIAHDRIAEDDPANARSFERLAADMARRDRRTGTSVRHTDLERAAFIERYIRLLRARLGFIEARPIGSAAA